MRGKETGQTAKRNRRVVSTASRLHRALVTGKGDPEDFQAAEAIFLRIVANHIESILDILRSCTEGLNGSAVAKRASFELKGFLKDLMGVSPKGGFYKAIDQEGGVNRRVLGRLLDIDQEIGGGLLVLSQIARQLRRRRSPHSISDSLNRMLRILADLREALQRRSKI